MKKSRTLTLCLTALLGACGAESSVPASQVASASSPSAQPAAVELTAQEIEQGVGPIHDLELTAVDPALAEEGAAAFTTKCSACHKIEERYVAPALGEVLSRRRPEFVMNMMLNANEMVKRHPVIQELLAEYFTPMPVQVTDPDEARAILEYLRSAQIESN